MFEELMFFLTIDNPVGRFLVAVFDSYRKCMRKFGVPWNKESDLLAILFEFGCVFCLFWWIWIWIPLVLLWLQTAIAFLFLDLMCGVPFPHIPEKLMLIHKWMIFMIFNLDLFVISILVNWDEVAKSYQELSRECDETNRGNSVRYVQVDVNSRVDAGSDE